MSIDTTFPRRCIASLERATRENGGYRYGFAETTRGLLPDFFDDAKAVADMIVGAHDG